MNKRVSITLAVCMIGALGTVAALFLPAQQTSTATPAAATAEATHDQHDGAAQSDAAAAAPSGDARTVNIESFAFSAPIVVSPGEQITVSNLDSAPHTMTAFDGSFDTGNISGGSSATLTMPTEPGTYEFFCSVHPSMVSTITVQS